LNKIASIKESISDPFIDYTKDTIHYFSSLSEKILFFFSLDFIILINFGWPILKKADAND